MNQLSTEMFCMRLQSLIIDAKDMTFRRKLRKEFEKVNRQSMSRHAAAAHVMNKFGWQFEYDVVNAFVDAIDEQLKPVHPNRKSIDPKEKEMIWVKQGCRCANPNCHKKGGSIHEYHIDHLVPFDTAFDTLGMDNLVVLCEQCSMAKSDKIIPWAIELFVRKKNEKMQKRRKNVIYAEDIIFEQQTFLPDEPDSPQHLVQL